MRSTIFLLLAVSAWAQEQNGAIEGVVVDSASHMPVKRAQVLLLGNRVSVPSRPGMPVVPPQPKSVATDAGGVFAFHDLSPGRYDLQVQHQRYPLPRNGIIRRTVVVKPGEKAEPITFELLPGAAVSGRVLDEEGDPIVGCFVQVRARKNAVWAGMNQAAEPTNENGEYRVWGIQPGKYIVAVHCMRPVFQPRPLSAGPSPPPSIAYVPQFYPLTRDPQAAEVIDLAPGSDRSGVDFHLTVAPVYTVRGSLTSTGVDWRNREDLSVNLLPLDPAMAALGASRAARFERKLGTFEFQSVFPGSYTLLAYTQGGFGKRIGARQSIEVVDRPLEGALELRAAMDLTGTIEIEGERTFLLSQIGLQVMPADHAPTPAPPLRVQEDGTFTMQSVLPGVWRFQAYASGAVFIKSVWMGSQELTDRVLDTTAGPAGPLRILLSTKTATIRGTATPGQTIYLLSGDNTETFGLQAEVNERGEFVLSGLAPGRYHIAAGAPTGPSEEGEREISVAEGETVRADMK